jgi:hypothetical protein
MRPFGTQPAVDVSVNGRGPLLFLIDTGASGQARIDAATVTGLGIPVVRSEQGVGVVSGESVEMRVVRVDSLGLGPVQFRDVEAPSRNYNDPDSYAPDIGGILAFGLFENRLLTLDFPRNRVLIERGELPEADGRTVLAYDLRNGVAHIEVAFGETRVWAVIDTGTDVAINMPLSLVRQFPLSEAPRPAGRTQTATRTFGISAAPLAVNLRIGRHVISEPRVTFSEVYENVILGSELLRRFSVTFDQKNRRVRFQRR